MKRTLFATYLCTQLIANEEPVLDLDHSNDIVVHHVISPEILLCESVILRKLVVLKVSLLLGRCCASELLLLRRYRWLIQRLLLNKLILCVLFVRLIVRPVDGLSALVRVCKKLSAVSL